MIKRSIILINKPFQYRYSAVAIASIMVSMAVIWLCIWLFNRADHVFDITQDLSAAINTFAKYVTFRLAIMAVLVSIFALYVSHKVAGPMYRFQKTLEAVTTGDLTIRAFLRDGDEMNDVKDALNQTLISIHSRVRQDKEKAAKAVKTLQSIRESMSKTVSPEDLESIVRKLEALEKELNDIGNRFKI